MEERLLAFALILTRLSGFFLVMPVFSWSAVPTQMRVGMALALSIFFALWHPLPFHINYIAVVPTIILMVQEATYGLALGIIAQCIFLAVRCSGQIIEQQMGLTMAEILDPLTGDSVQPLSSILEMIFVLLFFSANGHHVLLLALARSYETFPLGSPPDLQSLVGGVARAGSMMLVCSLRLSAPILAAFLVMLVMLGILARILPEMNILFISMPVRVAIGLILIIQFLPFLQEFVSEFSHWMEKLLPV